MSKTLKVRNWSKWQSYRSDRGQPPWIKLHRCIMRDEQWVAMTSTQRGQLIAIWLLAADRDGSIPSDPVVVQKLCFMDETPDLKWFVDNKFLTGDASVTPERRQPDANVTHQNRGEENRGEENTPSASPPKSYAFKGRVIRLTHDDHDQWQQAYKQLDLQAELIARDEWLAEQPDGVQAKWYASTSKFLANRNMEAKAKGAPVPAKTSPSKPVFNTYKKFESETEIKQPSIAEREAQVERLLKKTALAKGMRGIPHRNSA